MFNFIIPTAGETICVWIDFGNQHVHEEFVEADYDLGGVGNWQQVLTLSKVD